MTTKTGTVLAEVAGISTDVVGRLAELWITTAEEFASAAYQNHGRASLAQFLDTTAGEIAQLLAAVEAALPDGVDFAEDDIALALGALPVADVANPDDEPVAFDDLPATVDWRDRLPAVRNQSSRGTCVAHAAVAVREHLMGEGSVTADLSEQFLYWACKERDGYAGAGTWIKTAMEVLVESGVCSEAVWPYNGNVIVGNEGQGPPPAEAGNEAAAQRIDTFTALNATWVDSFRSALAAGQLIAFSVHVFASCQRPHTFRTGDLRLPLPKETDLGGHAMCAVGYVDAADVPGGGYFIVRNSWGEAFGYDGEIAGGYCRIPYAYVRQYGIEACTVGWNQYNSQ